MTIMYSNIIIASLIILALFALGIWLQLFLSKKESRCLGLILPAVTFVFSLLTVLNIVDTGDAKQNIILVVSTLLLSNIPTIIFLVIYFACREKIKRRSQLEKMNIQDL